LKLAQRAYAIMERLPDIDWNSAHVLAEELSGNAAEQKFETFFDLLLDLAARLARAAATGEGEQRERALAARVIPDGRLAAWADLWEAVTQRKAEVMALNLDRKALILDTLAQIQAVARR
jgi:DNA polymerase-3 subunit delta'